MDSAERTVVFVCHSHQDKPFVRRLASSLRLFGIDAWVDQAEISHGESLIQKISSAIEQLDVVLAIISSNSVGSSWVTKELSMAMTKEITLNRIVVIPILVERCDMPLYLRDKLYADFTNPMEYGLQLSRLAKSIRGHHIGSNAQPLSLYGALGDKVAVLYRPTRTGYVLSAIMAALASLAAAMLFLARNDVPPALRPAYMQFIVVTVAMFTAAVVALTYAIIVRQAILSDSSLGVELGSLHIPGLPFRPYRRVVRKYWHNKLMKAGVVLEVLEYAVASAMIVALLRAVELWLR